VAAIEYAARRPVLVDIEPDYWTMDPAKLEAAITPRTKAIMPVHLYGQPATWIRSSPSRAGTAFRSSRTRRRRTAPSTRAALRLDGLLGCFSFYPGKNLGAYGEGGAVVTDDPALAARIRLLRAWGEEVRYEHKFKAFNYRMDGVQGRCSA
jgi:dTDP-4-amino-4,6-dideoxygalactose transaminase